MTKTDDRVRDDDLLSRLGLSARVVTAGRPRGAVTFSERVPELPREIADAVARDWGLTIARASHGIDPFTVPSFRWVAARIRTQQVLRALSGRTNLLLPAAAAIVVGDAALAQTLARTLTALGARVALAGPPRGARLRAYLDGLTTIDVEDLTTQAADQVFATGEGHPPIDPALLRGVVVDASWNANGLTPVGAATPVRESVLRLRGGDAIVVETPPALPHHVADADGLAWELADFIVATALLAAEGDALDARLAALMLA